MKIERGEQESKNRSHNDVMSWLLTVDCPISYSFQFFTSNGVKDCCCILYWLEERSFRRFISKPDAKRFSGSFCLSLTSRLSISLSLSVTLSLSLHHFSFSLFISVCICLSLFLSYWEMVRYWVLPVCTVVQEVMSLIPGLLLIVVSYGLTVQS